MPPSNLPDMLSTSILLQFLNQDQTRHIRRMCSRQSLNQTQEIQWVSRIVLTEAGMKPRALPHSRRPLCLKSMFSSRFCVHDITWHSWRLPFPIFGALTTRWTSSKYLRKSREIEQAQIEKLICGDTLDKKIYPKQPPEDWNWFSHRLTEKVVRE
jgi:hypothetical protein